MFFFNDTDREVFTVDDLFKGRRRALANALIVIVNELQDYWPMTVRGIYYRAVSARDIDNCDADYKATSAILTTLRRKGLLPWDAIEDRSRSTIDKRGVPTINDFFREQFSTFLDARYYQRCYMKDQSTYVELLIEKDAISTIVAEGAYYFCSRVNIGRGQSSASIVNQFADRLEAAQLRGQETMLLVLSDFDPTGVQLPLSVEKVFRETHPDLNTEVRRIALTPEQIESYNLPQSIDAAKPADPNYGRWLESYGRAKPVEIDALHPADLKALVESELSDIFDMSLVELEKTEEVAERNQIRKMRREFKTWALRKWPGVITRDDFDPL